MNQEYSQKIPIIKFVLLNIFSINLYQAYWFYKNWWIIKNYYKKGIKPVPRMIGFLIPVLNIWLIYDQFKLMEKLVNKKNIKTKASPIILTLLYLILGVIALNISDLLKFSDTLISPLIFSITIIPLVLLQISLNSYWEKVEKANLKIVFTGFEKIMIAFGAFIWITFFLVIF